MQGSPKYPLRLAAIDVGSNAIRFVASEFASDGGATRLDTIRAPVRLGRDVFSTGVLNPDLIEAATSAIASFARRMESLDIVAHRAVATSAVRESANGDDLVDRVRAACRIELERITGADEARLVWRAVRDRIPERAQGWTLIDVGGGSVELTAIGREGVLWSESHPVGTVRLLQELEAESRASATRFRRLLEHRASVLSGTIAARGVHGSGLIASGGNADALADLVGIPPAGRQARHLPTAALVDAIQRLSELSVAERMDRLGLRPDRADVILPAAILYAAAAAAVGATEILIPEVGVREGVLLDLLDDLQSHRQHERHLEQEIASSAIALGRHYRFEEPHALQVARLALSVFDQLQELHGLGEADRHALLAAGLLHDVGQIVSYRKHHKHSQYLIANADLAGLSPREIHFVSLLARYHRGAPPREGHEGLADLSSDERQRLDRLASILRIGDALDREHRQSVREAHAALENGALVLRLRGEGDLFPEQWALQKKARLFSEVFGVAVRVEVLAGSGVERVPAER